MPMVPDRVTRGVKNPLHFALPKRLKKARKEARLSLARLGEKAGLSGPAVGNIERGDSVPGIDTIEHLARALGLSPCFLACGMVCPFKEMDTPMHLGLPARLKSLREARGYSRNALGNESGTADMTIEHIEEGENVPRVDTVEKLAKVLKVSPCWLAYGCGPDPLGPEERARTKR